MDRVLIYPGQVPLETDLLRTNRNAMIALGRLAQDVLGTATTVAGLACAPTSPASMSVNIGAGALYSVQNVDNSAYSSIAADTTDQIMKQGIVLASDNISLTMAAPLTSGYSVIYLIEAAFSETDTGTTVLPYYNSSNPGVPYSGPGGSSAAQATTRKNGVVLLAKAGVASASPTAPTVDAGYVALYTVTIPYGATQITSGMIAVASGAPFLGGGLSSYLLAATAAATYAPLASPALTGTPTAPTPAQFDASTRIATMAAVQRQAGNFAGYSALSGTQTLAASVAGFYMVNTTTGTASWTLPNATINAGYCLAIENAGTGVLTLTSGGGVFSGPFGSGTTTLTIAVGATVEIVADGAKWHCYAGSGGAASLTSSGYQKLPSGLIIQWGVTGTFSAEGGQSVTFPIAFPNAIFAASATPDLPAASSSQDAIAQVYAKSTTGMGIYMQYPSGGSTTWGMTADWFAIGY